MNPTQVHMLSVARKRGVPQPGNRVIDIRAASRDGALLDFSGNGNDLVGRSGRAISLNGITDHLEIPADSRWNIDGQTISFSGMFKPDAISGSQTLFSTSNADENGGFQIFLNSVGKIQMFTRQNGVNGNHTSSEASNVTANSGVWNTVSGTIEGGFLTSLILNGTEETSFSNGGPTGTYADSGNELLIGARNDGEDYFSGELTDMQFNGSHWRLNEYASGSLDGNVALDSSDNENHGEYVGCEVAGNDLPWPVPQVGLMDGSFAGEFRPDGEGSYAEIEYDPSLNVTTEVTWAFIIDGEAMQAVAGGGVHRYLAARWNIPNQKRTWALLRHLSLTVNDGKLTFWLSNTGLYHSAYNYIIPDCPQSHFLLVLRKTANDLIANINGGPNDVISTNVPNSLFTTDIEIRVGVSFTGTHPSDTGISFFKMWDVALTDSEVTQLYHSLKRYIT